MNTYMREAIDEAKNGIHNGEGGPFGCIIVKNNKIVGRGHNTVLKNQDPTCHGEVNAIKDACKKLGTYDLSGCELYTTAQPCPMCKGAILWSNIRTVYYGCNIKDTDSIGFRDEIFFNDDSEFQKELDRDSCLELFQEYSNLENKTIY